MNSALTVIILLVNIFNFCLFTYYILKTLGVLFNSIVKTMKIFTYCIVLLFNTYNLYIHIYIYLYKYITYTYLL